MPSNLGKLPVALQNVKARARAEYAKLPTRSKADDPEKYTKNPHEYGDILISGGKLGGTLQRDLIYWIERYTWGTNSSKVKGVITRPEYAKLSLSGFAKLCQVYDKGKLRPVEKKSIAVALADLERRGIIEARDRKGCGPTTAKMYKLTPEKWAKAKPYEPPTPKEIEDAEACAGEEDETIPEPDPASPDSSTVASGKVSRPQPVSMRIKDAPAVTIRIVYNPRGFDFPVTFSSRPGANGRLQVTATPHRHSEEKANDYGCAQPQLKNQTVESKRLADFDLAINRITLRVWGKAADDTVIAEVIKAAGAAPVEYFQRIADRDKRLDQRKARDNSPRVLRYLAAEACTSFAKEQAIQARDEADRPKAVISTPEQFAELEKAEQAREAAILAEQARPKCKACKGTGRGKEEWLNIGGHYGPRSKACPACEGSGKAAAK